ncbi:large subunit GTPase 1 homolog isoform 1-T1 [Vipera latastei]
MGKKQAGALGRSLRCGVRAGGAGWRHTSELSGQGRAPPPQSVTEQSPLEAFLAAAELAGAAFAAEKLDVRLVPPGGAAEEAGRPREEQERRVLRVPRRPPWDEQTSPAALEQAERDSFLRWRRQLAWMEEEENLLLTPFERNLDFWRQLWRVLERSDVVVQIVDARNPLLFRCRDLECYAKEISPEKENLILLNKADLLAEEQRSAWARFFEKEGVRVVFWSALAEGNRLGGDPEELETRDVAGPAGQGAGPGEQLSSNGEAESPPGTQRDSDVEEDGDVYEDCEEEEEEAWLTCSEDGEQETPVVPLGRSRAELSQPAPPRDPPVRNSSRLVQRDELLEMFETVHAGRKKVREGQLTVGLVGYPNVGKSSTINTILGKKKVSVSATPGRTKHFQTLFVEPSLCLCDCPGLVMPSFVSTKAEMVCSGILPIDQLRDHVPPVTLVCQRIPRPVLEATYGISILRPREDEDPDRTPTSEELLSALGCMRGFMTDHGQPDQPRSARLVLKDYVTGKLLYCHPPPGVDAKLFQAGLERLRPSKGAAAAAAQCNGQPPSGRDPRAKQMENPVDLAFFHQENVRALTRGNRARVGYPAETAAHLPSGPGLADGAGKPWKRHGNRNKKQKLRRLTRHLEA